MKSVSPETLKAIKESCRNIAQHMDYFKHNTEINRDPYVFPRLALIASLCEQVADHINE